MFRPRSTGRRPRRGGLAWPILLTVPPVIVLSIVAILSLRQDRATIEADARRSAELLSTDLARRVSSGAATRLASLVASACSGAGLDLPGTRDHILCGLFIDGRIRVPLDYPLVPSTPDWRQATPAAVRLKNEWATMRTELNGDETSDATERLVEFARQSGDAIGESGAPLADIALLLALRRLPAGNLPDSLLRDVRRRVIESPSFLTADLIAEAARVAQGNPDVVRLSARWAANQRALALLRDVPLPVDATHPAETWLGTGRTAWVALVRPLAASRLRSAAGSRTALQVTLVPAPVLERVFQAVASERSDIPEYARAVVHFGGRTLTARDAAATGGQPVQLASAGGELDPPPALPADVVSTFSGELLRVAQDAIAARQDTPGILRLNGVAGGHPFTVALELADPDLLYATYRSRLLMAIGLIVVATVAALAGLGGAWRAFERQRRLGEMKSNFVASVSHELRAPIASVRLMTESLERGAVEPGARQQEYLRVIGQECRRLSSLVENVLDFSRIDRGQRQYTFEPTDLPALLAQTIDVMRPYAEQRNVKLTCAPLPAHAAVTQLRADRQALQQALINLLDNAIKHSPAGADVVVGLEADVAAAPPIVRFFVDDHGPGIPAEDHERIFEPFYRRGSELRRETAGIGIGLSIVKHVAEAHGGRVVVRSSPGAGSRFAIELVDRQQSTVNR